MTATQQFLDRPLTVSVGQPLRVAVYSRLAEGIRAGIFPLASALPRETELGAALGVSRTVVREALMLLEEDGLISTRRGVGRFVADALPVVGLEELRPLEEALADAGDDVGVRQLEFVLQPSTDFVGGRLGLDAEANTWFRESVIERAGEPVALLQEHLPAGRYLSDISTPIAAVLEEAAGDASSLLAALAQRGAASFVSAVCEVTAGVVGSSRGELLGLDETDPVLILTQTASVAAGPVYLAKCIVSAKAGVLSVVQTAQ
ncbi:MULTISPECIES: GntR family transcriptional regulator [unclassified Microbacterium]|uniref:GntR family transcriptional regulator n=1 Tax=unclassified Microbacterium TaxID=2609290 RepID=UPI0012F8564D|nr:GntR family transcriptional regulator [Microbacterium sp. MAH-37]MVQ41679.1 GntR family transcriptional regulator [Microbacterium sp. MAH-37]